jgi:hypothetical protein
VGSGAAELGRFVSGNYFAGQLEEFRVWKLARGAGELRGQMNKRLLGNETGLTVYYRFDEGTGTEVVNAADGGGYLGTLRNGVTWQDSTAPAGIPPRYVTIVENNDPAVLGAPVNLYVIRIDDGPFRGNSSDFGGDP